MPAIAVADEGDFFFLREKGIFFLMGHMRESLCF